MLTVALNNDIIFYYDKQYTSVVTSTWQLIALPLNLNNKYGGRGWSRGWRVLYF